MSNVQTDIEQLWKEYKEDNDIAKKQKIMLHYTWLVKYAMNNIPLPVNSILEEGDFVSVGMIALSDTIDKFDLSRGFKFETYAIQRIKGIIRDELRRIDFLSRSTRKKAQDFQSAVEKVKLIYGGEISNEAIRKNLNVSQEKFKSYLEAAAIAKSSLSLNDSSTSTIILDDEEINLLEEIPDESSNFLDQIHDKERKKLIFEQINKLKENHRLMLTLYYFEDLTFKEIGKILNVSESRVSQIHSQILNELKNKLSELKYA